MHTNYLKKKKKTKQLTNIEYRTKIISNVRYPYHTLHKYMCFLNF